MMLTVYVLFIILFCWLLYKLYQSAKSRTGQPENKEQAEQLEREIVPEQHEKEWQAESKTVEKIHLTEPTSEAQYEANESKYRNYPGDYPPDWEWRSHKVKERDEYTCQASPEKVGLPTCSKVGREEELHAHHIIPISKGGKHSFENLITLCLSCHDKLHPHMRLGLDVDISTTTDRQMSPKVRLLQNAIVNAKDVWLDYYTAYRDDQNERTVTPINLYYRNNSAYLRAYCHWRKEERTFRISRIRNMRVLDGEKLYQPTQEQQRQPSKQKQQRPPQIAVEKLKQQRSQPQAPQPKVVRKLPRKSPQKKNLNDWKEPDPFLKPFLDPKLGWEDHWDQKYIDLLEEEVLNLDMTQEGCLPLWFPWTLFKPPNWEEERKRQELPKEGYPGWAWDEVRVPPDFGEPVELNPQERAKAFHELLVSQYNPEPKQPYESLSTEQKLKLKSTVAEHLLDLYEERDTPYDLPIPEFLLNPQATQERGNQQMPSKRQPTTRFVRPYQPLEEVQERLLSDLLKDLESEKKLQTYLRSQPKQP